MLFKIGITGIRYLLDQLAAQLGFAALTHCHKQGLTQSARAQHQQRQQGELPRQLPALCLRGAQSLIDECQQRRIAQATDHAAGQCDKKQHAGGAQ